MTHAPEALSAKQWTIAPIGAAMARGDMVRLDAALNRALDAKLTVAEAKEVLVQLYAYAGFPRSLNALGQLMKLLDQRRQRGVRDEPGSEPATPVPTGRELLERGTAVQTQLSGAPVKGPLFDFAPAIDQFLKAHLFGDIFLRDHLDWRSRELATVGALAALPGLEPQLLAHVRISLNVGLTVDQLGRVATEFGQQGEADAAQRLKAALAQLAAGAPR